MQLITELRLLLGLRGVRGVPREPPALHQPQPAPGLLLPGGLHCVSAGQLLHPPPAEEPQAGRQQGQEDPQARREPSHWPLQPRLLPQLHLRGRSDVPRRMSMCFPPQIGSWVSFTLMTQCLPAGLFTLAGAYQMTVWALGKHRNYRAEFKVGLYCT